MAKILSKVGITTGYALESSFVTQSINAFTGGEAYDISLSGSFNMTGSFITSGSLTVGGITAINDSTLNGNITLNNTTITGSLLATGSISTVGDLTTVGLITGTDIFSPSGGGLSSDGDLTISGNSILGTPGSTSTTINGNITGSKTIIVDNFISGSTIIGNKNGMSQNNSGGAVNIGMTTTTYPPDSIISITQTTSNNAISFTLPAPEQGLEYTFLANVTSTGTGTTLFNASSAIIDGIFICSDQNRNLNGLESIGFDQTKFIKGTRVHFVSDGTNWIFTAYCLCIASDTRNS